jgi:hypothetical protein
MVSGAHIKKNHVVKQEVEHPRVSDNSNVTSPAANRMNQIEEESEDPSDTDGDKKTKSPNKQNFTQEVRRENENMHENKKQRMSV